MLSNFALVGSVLDAWHFTENDTQLKLQEIVQLQYLTPEREIKRCGSYFKGWCADFGEHEHVVVGENENCWLIGENQVGLILPKPQLKQLYHEVLLHEQVPAFTCCQKGIQIGTLLFSFKSEFEKRVSNAIEELIGSDSDLYLFLTSHFLYENGSRIITLSSKKPPSIIYRVIGTMEVRLQEH